MEKRDRRVKAFFSSAEYEDLTAKAQAANMTVAKFIRFAVKNKEVKAAPDADVITLIRLMRTAGFNLDMTLKNFAASGVPDMERFRSDIEELRAATRAVVACYANGDG